MSAPHLWEIDHPYYCHEGNYYQVGHHDMYGSWADFATDGDLLYSGDQDLNLVWRWDWKRADPADYFVEPETEPDFELPGDRLLVFFMLQRKAICISIEIAVTEADEPAVRAWLTERAAVVRAIWEPLLSEGVTS